METIDYPKRSDMVAALVEARKKGVAVEVVGNGRTLKFPEGIDGLTIEGDDAPEEVEETPATEEESLVGVVQPEEEEEVEAATEEETAEALAEAAQATTEDDEAAEEETVEDLIGEAPAPSRPSRSNKRKK